MPFAKYCANSSRSRTDGLLSSGSGTADQPDDRGRPAMNKQKLTVLAVIVGVVVLVLAYEVWAAYLNVGLHLH